MADETGRPGPRTHTCAKCAFSRIARNGVTLMCDADGMDSARTTYKTHSCILWQSWILSRAQDAQEVQP